MSLRRKKIRWLSQEEGNGCGKKIGQMSGIFKLSEKEMMRRERVGVDVNSREAVPAAQKGQVQEGLQESTTPLLGLLIIERLNSNIWVRPVCPSSQQTRSQSGL